MFNLKKENVFKEETETLIQNLKNLHVFNKDEINDFKFEIYKLNDVELEKILDEVDSTNKDDLYKVALFVRNKY